MTFKVGDDGQAKEINRLLQEQGFSVKATDKKWNGRTVYEVKESSTGEVLRTHELNFVLSRKISDLKIIKNKAFAFGRGQEAKDAQKALDDLGEVKTFLKGKHVAVVNKKEQAGKFFAKFLLLPLAEILKSPFHLIKLGYKTVAQANRVIFMAGDAAPMASDLVKGDFEKIKLRSMVINANDYLRRMTIKQPKLNFEQIYNNLFRSETFLEGKDVQDSKKKILSEGNFKASIPPLLESLVEKKLTTFIKEGSFTPFDASDKSIRLLGLSPDQVDKLNLALGTEIQVLDKKLEDFRPDPDKQAAFYKLLDYSLTRRNNILKYTLRNIGKGISYLARTMSGQEASKRDIVSPTRFSDLSSMRYNAQKSMSETSSQTVKDLIRNRQTLSAKTMIEKGLFERVSNNLLSHIIHAKLPSEDKDVLFSALYKNARTVKEKGKIIDLLVFRGNRTLAASLVQEEYLQKIEKGEKVDHLTMLAARTGDRALSLKLLGIDRTTITPEALFREHPELLQPLEDGSILLHHVMKSGDPRLVIVAAEAQKLLFYSNPANSGKPYNPYLHPDKAGNTPVHYMDRGTANALDKHYFRTLNGEEVPLDGNIRGSFSKIAERWEVLSYQPSNKRVFLFGLAGKFTGSAIGTEAIIQIGTQSVPVVTKALEINAPVYLGLGAGGLSTFPIQKAINHIYVAFHKLDLNLSQYEKSEGYALKPEEIKRAPLPTELKNYPGPEDVKGYRALRGISHETLLFESAFARKDVAALTSLILADSTKPEGQRVVLSQNELRKLAKFRYFPEYTVNGKVLDTRQLIFDFLVEQTKHHPEAQSKTLEKLFESQIGQGLEGAKASKMAIDNWLSSVEAEGTKNLGDAFFQSPIYRSMLISIVKLGDLGRLERLRKLENGSLGKPLFYAIQDHRGSSLLHLAGKNARMFLEVEKMMYLHRDIETRTEFSVNRRKQAFLYLTPGGISSSPAALRAFMSGKSSIGPDPLKSRDARGQTVMDTLTLDEAIAIDELRAKEFGEEGTLTSAVIARDPALTSQLQMEMTMLAPVKAGFYYAIASAVDASVLAASTFGAIHGGPGAQFWAAYAANVSIGLPILVATVLFAAVGGEFAEKGVDFLEDLKRGYPVETFAYGRTGEERQTSLDQAREYLKVNPEILKRARDAVNQSIREAVFEAIGDDPKLEAFRKVTDDILAANGISSGNTMRLLFNGIKGLGLTPKKMEAFTTALKGSLESVTERTVAKLMETPPETP